MTNTYDTGYRLGKSAGLTSIPTKVLNDSDADTATQFIQNRNAMIRDASNALSAKRDALSREPGFSGWLKRFAHNKLNPSVWIGFENPVYKK